MSKGSERGGGSGGKPSAGGVPDDVLLPLKERVRDWTEYDVASYFLGEVLGVISPSDSYGDVKHLFVSGGHNAEGVELLDILILLVDQGLLESRGNNSEFRWNWAGDRCGTGGSSS